MIEPKAKDIEALCAAKGMRMTEQRRVIARVLAAADDHPDVEELYRRCSAVDDRISISTVYRTVKLFEDAGIIERHDFRDGRARYEQIPESHHDHLINLRTGEVIEFQSEEIERLQAEVARSSATSWSTTGSSSTPCRSTTRPRRCKRRRRHSNCQRKTAKPAPSSEGRWPSWPIAHVFDIIGESNSRTCPGARQRLDQTGMSGARKVYIKSYGCQMNVYDSHRMADTLAPEGFAETATPDDADLVILNTCHIREKAAEKVYSELGRMRVLKQEAAREGRERDDRGRRLRRAGRRRGDHPPRAGGRSRGRPAELSPPAGAARARRRAARPSSTPNSRSRTSSSICAAPSRAAIARARRLGVRHRAGRLRQVLHLLRRALYARRRSLAAGRRRSSPRPSGSPTPACARSRCSARTSTPITATDRTAAPGRSAGCCIALAEMPGIARLRYTTSHPRDMDDEPDRRASRPAGADAVPAPAGAVGLRPHPRRR